MRRAMLVMVSLVLLLSWEKTAASAILPDLTNWGGDYLLSLVQSKVNGKVTAQKISGNPLSGVVYQDLRITDPDGKVVVACDERLNGAVDGGFRVTRHRQQLLFQNVQFRVEMMFHIMMMVQPNRPVT